MKVQSKCCVTQRNLSRNRYSLSGLNSWNFCESLLQSRLCSSQNGSPKRNLKWSISHRLPFARHLHLKQSPCVLKNQSNSKNSLSPDMYFNHIQKIRFVIHLTVISIFHWRKNRWSFERTRRKQKPCPKTCQDFRAYSEERKCGTCQYSTANGEWKFRKNCQ